MPFRQFPMKYLSAGALFFDAKGRLLIVKPTYKDGWEIPGGIVEADESPVQACIREVREEIGLDITAGHLLVMDYKPRHDDLPDSLQMVFLGGTLTPEQIAAIRLPPDELSEYRFVEPESVLRVLRGTLARRVAASLRALKEGSTLMLHDGEPV